MFTFNQQRLTYDKLPDGKFVVELLDVVDKSNLSVLGNDGSVQFSLTVKHPSEFERIGIKDTFWLDPKFAPQEWRVSQDSRRLKKFLIALGMNPNVCGNCQDLVGSQVVMTVVNKKSKKDEGRTFTNIVSYEAMPTPTRSKPW